MTTTSRNPQRTSRRLDLSMPALVTCDIDGTLLNTGEPVSPAVRAAVAEVLAAGHHVALATGRSLVGALPVAAELGLDDAWIVASNGAVTAHVMGDDYEISDLHVIEPEPVVRVAVEAMPGIRVAAELVGVGYRVNIPFPDGELNGDQHSVAALEELWADATPRLALYRPGAFGLAPILRAMSLTVIETRPDWLDVTPPALSKATALDKVRRHLGIEFHATAAIGDGENDLEMLRWATRSIAMGHAPAHVRAVADRETGTIDEDGAAEALLSLLG
ncbi:HAD family hydrolase [Promicromonospora iranensis]|uniref:Hydroxymethylpyrimidine pyrophosphatase-like HAD family hydrolase n=1 Tax=Promicromonospora iranensis TaxID=1105144 RepID=A0ABU2CQU0_9MICO|nr:HAD family hydrolase [Promicromonospora iranensis]MDR7383641.1 hydroxymethylpyrimidine pyrophosphatase-like HAD family hydrolase [Promicromonospora iranensis]